MSASGYPGTDKETEAGTVQEPGGSKNTGGNSPSGYLANVVGLTEQFSRPKARMVVGVVMGMGLTYIGLVCRGGVPSNV
jgi:hypothetical protein